MAYSLLKRVIEGDNFRSPFSSAIFRVKKVYADKALLEDIENQHHQVITEVDTVVSIYEKVDGP
jgi:hypothetical protein